MTPVDVVCLTISFFIISCVHNVKGIRCYQCNTFEDAACAEIKPNATGSPFLRECAPRDGYRTFCRKIVQSISASPNSKRTVRTCGWLVYKRNSSLCQNTDTDFKLETTCQCFEDSCNEGRALTPIFSGIGTLILTNLCRFRLS